MIQDLSTYFKGDWKFERKIQFAGSMALYAQANGDAILEKGEEENVLQYHEKGILKMAETQHQHPFFRKYKYNITAEGLDIFFNDELTRNFNLYQQYILETATNKLVPKEIHVCNKDLYEGDFSFTDAAHFIHTSVITGPLKNYIITSEYSKIDTLL